MGIRAACALVFWRGTPVLEDRSQHRLCDREPELNVPAQTTGPLAIVKQCACLGGRL